jgi:hypothetical protein
MYVGIKIYPEIDNPTPELRELNKITLKTCHDDPAQRYATAPHPRAPPNSPPPSLGHCLNYNDMRYHFKRWGTQ